MPDSREASSSLLFGARAAVPLIGAFLFAVAGVAAFSLWEAPRRAGVEKFSQDTAVGDAHIFKVPFPPSTSPAPVLTWEGRAMVPVSYEKVKIEDTAMHRVYSDVSTGLTLYRPEKKEGTYIKIEIGEYLEVKAR